jgi:hypothetical protein
VNGVNKDHTLEEVYSEEIGGKNRPVGELVQVGGQLERGENPMETGTHSMHSDIFARGRTISLCTSFDLNSFPPSLYPEHVHESSHRISFPPQAAPGGRVGNSS